ncbi:twitching motility protein [Opitutaceae bacterium TAV5]|nr:twitching motility protein [Opitutaceae bacterium TAV5]
MQPVVSALNKSSGLPAKGGPAVTPAPRNTASPFGSRSPFANRAAGPLNSLDEALQFGESRSASDIHFMLNAPLGLRVDGDIVKMKDLPVGEPLINEVLDLLTPEQRRLFLEEGHAADFAINRIDRDMRCHLYKAGGRPALAVRFMRSKIPSMEDVMLPPAFQAIIKEGRPTGLILVTGYTGSGKSTTLAAAIDYLNQHNALNIVTLEQPVEYRYTPAKSLIHQREVGRDVPSFQAGMVDAMREDPDVILIGELRDAETVKAAVSAAETGHLVFGTLHTRNASGTISRIFDVVPADERDQIRTMVASSLLSVLCQRLVPRMNGGRVAAFELLLNCPAVAGAIRENKPGQVGNEIAVKKDMGMIDFDTCLVDYVRKKLITPETAIESSDRPDEIRRRLGMAIRRPGAGAPGAAPAAGGRAP